MKKIKYILSFSLLTIVLLGCENNDVEDVISEDAKPRVSYDVSSTTTTENDATQILVNITFDKPIKSSTRFTVEQIDGTAVLGEDYTFADAVVPAYTTEAQLVISIVKDLVVEGNETMKLKIGSTLIPDTYEVIGTKTIDVTIEDWVYCFWTLEGVDTYGDGWNGASIDLTSEGTTTSYTVSADIETFDIPVTDGADYSFEFVSGDWDGEVEYTLTSPDGTVFADSYYPAVGVITSGTNVCN